MEAKSETYRLLSESGAVLVRDKNHEVWKLPNGRMFTMPKTPSDHRAYDNQLSDLRRQLGVVDPERGAPGARRERKHSGEAPPRTTPAIGATVNRSLQESLLMSGLVASAKDERIEELEATLNGWVDLWLQTSQDLKLASRANCRKRKQLKRLQSQKKCWWCRLKRIYRQICGVSR